MDFLATPGGFALAILALGVLIIVHEGGHFLIARLSGMRVDRFSIGFGPRLFSFKRGETVYQIAAIPLGGFVQIAGLNPGEEGMAADDPRAYPNRPVWQRLATIFAGPATNYIFAAVMLVGIFLAWGVPGLGKAPVVDEVIEHSAAAAAGLQPDDEIKKVDGKKVDDGNQVLPIVNASGGRPIVVDIMRNGKPMAHHRDAGEERLERLSHGRQARRLADLGAGADGHAPQGGADLPLSLLGLRAREHRRGRLQADLAAGLGARSASSRRCASASSRGRSRGSC